MNERIAELWDKAAEDTMDLSWESQTKFMERFAELIINECISAVEDTNDRHRRDYFAAKIKQHFGIEE